MERLQKILARAGVASRRAAEALIADGRVSVNGAVVREQGLKVDPATDVIAVDGQPISDSESFEYFLLYKPPFVVTTLRDPQGRPTVGELLPRGSARLFPVGRLDYDAEGALLLTNDGDLMNRLLHPRYQVPRSYLVKLKRAPSDAALAKMVEGVRLEDGMARATLAERFHKQEKNEWVHLVVTEGRPHIVKRLCAAVGHPVLRLFRPSHAGVALNGLEPGQSRRLSDAEVADLRAVAEGAPPKPAKLLLPSGRHQPPTADAKPAAPRKRDPRATRQR